MNNNRIIFTIATTFTISTAIFLAILIDLDVINCKAKGKAQTNNYNINPVVIYNGEAIIDCRISEPPCSQPAAEYGNSIAIILPIE